MSTVADLLIELGTEELPPKSLRNLSTSFTASVQEQLHGLGISFGEVESFATPRRLAVRIQEVQTQQADEIVEKRGPAISAAFDAEGNATKAALGWARGAGIDVTEAERLVTDKGEWLLHKATVKGKPLAELLPEIVAHAAKALPVPKTMRWGTGEYSFIRPLKRLTVMLNAQVVPMHLFGIESNNKVLGHRFHCQDDITINHPRDYESALKQGYVIANLSERRETIKSRALAQAAEVNATPVWDDSLLDEVASLVEWPVAMKATFDAAFLDVPKEALIYTMKDDQRYFPLVDQQGQLLPEFLFVSNIESKAPEHVIEGNEKVIRPRLADAQFFFETDKKQSLASLMPKLDAIVFQKQLGTIGDKSRRMERLAGDIAATFGANVNVAKRAALLAKADLVSNMVTEFPEVQGIMGMHYARHDGEDEGVAVAIEAHYHPRFAGDTLPETLEGFSVALADKLDTLVGIFGIGQTPKGDKDPFALRRAAIGLLRILVEGELDLDLNTLVASAAAAYKGHIDIGADTQTEVVDFLLGRFRAWYQEQGIAVDSIQAVLARRPTRPLDFDRRVQAVHAFRGKEAAPALAAANKRVANILAKVESVPEQVNEKLLSEPAEVALVAALKDIAGVLEVAQSAGNYSSTLNLLAGLRKHIDQFFEDVMVNAEDLDVRNNRLALLGIIRNHFLSVADISLLQS
ncbi:glycine--tRNA ligase subunit beta [Aliidiomarina celeris]|uniref:glycine--tRNA ligase subunit beta n=1 Tax=Aliidiomarina celeris TaxID=2249428 RepID=UPI000DEADD79|nr:glycine--tRNA ligase subunit beta [Aliidiomarina celeris]